MPRLGETKLAGYRLPPWPSKITSELLRDGYSFTHAVVYDIEFISVWEVMKDGTAIWARVMNTKQIPTNYMALFFPEGLRPSNDLTNYDNICPILDVQLKDNWIFIFTESAITTLSRHCQNIRGNTTDYVSYWIPQVISGLTNLEALGYFHGDLCLDNILISKDATAKLTGFSMRQNGDVDTFVGFQSCNFRFQPPSENEEPAKADVWALGVIIYELLTGELLIPQGRYDPDRNINSQIRDYYDMLKFAITSKIIEQKIRNNPLIIDSAKNLLFSCLNPDPSQRPVIGLLADHDFFKGHTDDYQKNYLSSAPREQDFEETRQEILDVLESRGIKIKSKLGSGSFGQVLKVKYQNQYLALKITELSRATEADGYASMGGAKPTFDYSEEMGTEKEIMINLKHPNLVAAVNWFEDPEIGMFIFMEIAISSLWDQIKALVPFYSNSLNSAMHILEDRMKKWMREVGLGFQYLHQNSYAHLDFKPPNCLICDNDVAKVSDYGMALKISDPYAYEDNPRGNVQYQSPQMKARQPYRPFMADIWAYGLTILTCLHGSTVEHGTEEVVSQSSFSSEAKSLILSCLQLSEENRPTWDQILASRWFEDPSSRSRENN